MVENADGAARRPPADAVLAPIRNKVRALIVSRNRVLLLRKELADGRVSHALPGGTQEPGESLVEALLRECHEELGTHVELRELVHVVDFFKPRDSKRARYRHQVELIFRGRVGHDYVPHCGPHPDKYQVAVEWVGLQHLDDIQLRPDGMCDLVRRAALAHGPAYLGVLSA